MSNVSLQHAGSDWFSSLPDLGWIAQFTKDGHKSGWVTVALRKSVPEDFKPSLFAAQFKPLTGGHPWTLAYDGPPVSRLFSGIIQRFDVLAVNVTTGQGFRGRVMLVNVENTYDAVAGRRSRPMTTSSRAEFAGVSAMEAVRWQSEGELGFVQALMDAANPPAVEKDTVRYRLELTEGATTTG